MKLRIQTLPERKSNSLEASKCGQSGIWGHIFMGIAPSDGASCGWCWICAVSWETPSPLRSHNCFPPGGKKNGEEKMQTTDKQSAQRNQAQRQKKRRICAFFLGTALCSAAIWISFRFRLAFLLYYYCYSRSSKTIASGNWGLSSKLCFNVLRKSTFLAYTV